MAQIQTKKGYQFHTFSGVFLPSLLTILGVVMFMRLGTIVGQLGILGALGEPYCICQGCRSRNSDQLRRNV